MKSESFDTMSMDVGNGLIVTGFLPSKTFLSIVFSLFDFSRLFTIPPCHSACWILQSMRGYRIAKEKIDLLKCLAFGLGVEKDVDNRRYEVEGEEEVEVVESNIAERNRTALCEDQVDALA
jgi:hypothetical protein